MKVQTSGWGKRRMFITNEYWHEWMQLCKFKHKQTYILQCIVALRMYVRGTVKRTDFGAYAGAHNNTSRLAWRHVGALRITGHTRCNGDTEEWAQVRGQFINIEIRRIVEKKTLDRMPGHLYRSTLEKGNEGPRQCNTHIPRRSCCACLEEPWRPQRRQFLPHSWTRLSTKVGRI